MDVMTEYTLGSLARELGVGPGEIYRAAVDLKVRARKLAAHLTPAEVDRLRGRFTRSSAAPAPASAPAPTDTRGRDKSAYLAAAQPKRRPSAEPAAPSVPVVDPGVCECCEIPMSELRVQLGRRVCLECEPHRNYHGDDRTLRLAQVHAKWFRTQYLRSENHLNGAIEHEGQAVQRANRWVAALVRVIYQHGYTGECRICGTPGPCPVWRRLESVNKGIATKIINEFYKLSEEGLDRTLSDGYYESVYDQGREPE